MNSEPFPTSSHPPQGGIILFGKDLLTISRVVYQIIYTFALFPKYSAVYETRPIFCNGSGVP